MTQTSDSGEKIPLWRDERVLRILFQVLIVAIVVGIIAMLFNNATVNMRGQRFSLNFLMSPAGFNIGESLLPYVTNSPYYWAFIVGFVNTLRLILVGFILTTLLGVVAGIASFSKNWLLRKISQVYVEIVRNTPLLLQLFAWYFAFFLGLSEANETRQILAFFVNKQGIYIPWTSGTTVALSLGALVLLAIASFLVWRWRTKAMGEQGASGKPQLYALIGMGVAAAIILLFGLGWQFPRLEGNDVTGGLRLSIEYIAALTGLVFYTGAFIAEIVRAGIQSVSKGQWEAARAMGLQSGLVMRLVVLPQALRVIVPSLSSQYINLAKNSTLAFAIGYPEFFSTANTTLNQSGRAVEVMVLFMSVFLLMDLLISLVMNFVNRAVQIKER